MSAMARPRPSPEYSYALDICASEISDPQSEENAVIVSSSFYYSELGARLIDSSPTDQAKLVTSFYTLHTDPNCFDGLLESPDRYNTVIWAEPQRGTAYPIALAISKALTSGGKLLVVSSALLSRFLVESKQEGNKRNLGAGRTSSLFRDVGLRTINSYGFHSPTSIIWSYLSRAALMAGRGDLSDRFQLRARHSYIVKGYLAPLSSLRLFKCEKR